MIPKVNRSPPLSLVRSSKAPDHDPGSSQGSGNFYEKSGKKPSSEDEAAAESSSENSSSTEVSKPALSVVVSVEQAGMTEVVKDLLEQKQNQEAVTVNPGLTTRYSADSSNSKGLLLNKKVE